MRNEALSQSLSENADQVAMANMSSRLDASISAVQDFAANLFKNGKSPADATLDSARDFLLNEVLDHMIDRVVESTSMDEKAKEGWKKALHTVREAVESLNPEDVAKKLVLEVIPESAKVVLDTAEWSRKDLPKMLEMDKRQELAPAVLATPEEVEKVRAILSGELRDLDEGNRADELKDAKR